MKIRSVLDVDLAKESDGCHLELRGSANNGDNPVMRLGLHGRSVMEEIVITVGGRLHGGQFKPNGGP